MASRSSAVSSFSNTSSWKIDFLQSLVLRDKREKSFDGFISAYSHLALRTTTLASAVPPARDAAGKAGTELVEVGVGPDITQLKADLTTAQQSKSQLQYRIKSLSEEISTLQQKQEQFDRINLERNKFDRKAKDLEEEVRAKNKYIQELQDEILTLTMELNMLTKKEEATRKENKELVERFMAEMAKKAESMNRASNWE